MKILQYICLILALTTTCCLGAGNKSSTGKTSNTDKTVYISFDEFPVGWSPSFEQVILSDLNIRAQLNQTGIEALQSIIANDQQKNIDTNLLTWFDSLSATYLVNHKAITLKRRSDTEFQVQGQPLPLITNNEFDGNTAYVISIDPDDIKKLSPVDQFKNFIIQSELDKTDFNNWITQLEGLPIKLSIPAEIVFSEDISMLLKNLNKIRLHIGKDEIKVTVTRIDIEFETIESETVKIEASQAIQFNIQVPNREKPFAVAFPILTIYYKSQQGDRMKSYQQGDRMKS